MKILSTVVIYLVLTIPALAAVTYDCEVKSFSNTGGIMPRLILYVDEKNGTATAYDSLIHHIHNGPVPVEFEPRGAKGYRFHWTLKNIPLNGRNNGIITYTAGLSKSGNPVTVKAILHGFDNEIRGQGKCVILKSK